MQCTPTNNAQKSCKALPLSPENNLIVQLLMHNVFVLERVCLNRWFTSVSIFPDCLKFYLMGSDIASSFFTAFFSGWNKTLTPKQSNINSKSKIRFRSRAGYVKSKRVEKLSLNSLLYSLFWLFNHFDGSIKRTKYKNSAYILKVSRGKKQKRDLFFEKM